MPTPFEEMAERLSQQMQQQQQSVQYAQNRAQAGQQQQNMWGGMGQNLYNQLGQVANQGSTQQQWQNPYLYNRNGPSITGQFQNMANAPGAQQGAQSWQQQFGGQLQQAGPLNWQNPQMQQTQMNPAVGQFMNAPVNQMSFGIPGLGAGGQVATNVAQGGMPDGPGMPGGLMDPNQIQQARNAQLQGLTSAAGGGMSEQEIAQMMEAAMTPVMRNIGQQREQSLSDVSARGLGRSSEVGRVAGEFGDITAQAGQQAAAKVLEQAVQSRLANQAQQQQALSGLGEFAGQGLNYELGRGGLNLQGQGLANQYSLGQGQLGLGLGGLTQQGGQFADQMNLEAQNQAFNQLAQQAGLGAGLYQSDSANALQQYGMNQNYQLGQQGLNADMGQFNANQSNQGLLSLLGMGAQGAGQNFGQQQALLQSMLGASGQDLSGFQGYQNNLLQNILANQQLGYGGMQNIQQGMYGAGMNQEQFNQNLSEQQRQFQEQVRQYNEQQQGGGLGGFLGGALGLLGGSAIPGVGNIMGNWLGNQITGGGGNNTSSGASYGQYYNPLSMYGGG